MTLIPDNVSKDKEKIFKGIKEFTELMGTADKMPTSSELTNNNYGWLKDLIHKRGGFEKWSKILGLPFKKTYSSNEDAIKQEILETMKKGKLRRMPTSSEIYKINGNNLLNGKISRTHGFKGWAKILELDMKNDFISNPYSHLSAEKAITKGIKDVQKKLSIDRMPTSSEIRRLKLGWLDNLIGQNGGYIYWAKELNLDRKINRFQIMKDQEISEAIREIIKELRVNRMPTALEVEQSSYGHRLHNSITRTYGYREWAHKLRLNLKESETGMGLSYEEMVIELLRKKGYKVKAMTTNHPFDILVDNSIKIDVKTANPHILNSSKSRVHTFGLGKRYGSCDLYICLAIDENEKIEKTLIIPSHHLHNVTLSVGRNSKYDIYNNRFDLIDKYGDFFKKV